MLTMSKILIAAVLALAAAGAQAQGRLIVGANEVIDSKLAYEKLQAGGAQKGDIIGTNNAVAAFLCDFTQQIMTSPAPATMVGLKHYVFCTYIGGMRERVKVK